MRASDRITRSTTRDGKERKPHLATYSRPFADWYSCSWDEWVPEDRVLPPTDENYAQQQKLRELANPIPTPVKKKGAVSDGKKGTAAAGADAAPKGVKRSRDHDLEKVSIAHVKVVLNLSSKAIFSIALKSS